MIEQIADVFQVPPLIVVVVIVIIIIMFFIAIFVFIKSIKIKPTMEVKNMPRVSKKETEEELKEGLEKPTEKKEEPEEEAITLKYTKEELLNRHYAIMTDERYKKYLEMSDILALGRQMDEERRVIEKRLPELKTAT